MEENIQINIQSRGSNSSDNSTRNKLSKVEKIKKKRLEKEARFKNRDKYKQEPLENESKLSLQVKKQPPAGVKETSNVSTGDKPKFSSLFRNNPEIPQIESCEIDPIKENVFSSHNFSNLKIHPHLVACLENTLKVTKMTAVQEETIPYVLQGRDVLVKSQTGSGKTLSYAIPIVQKLQSTEPRIQRSDGPFAVIISPTRELTLQSFETFQKLVRSFVWIVPGCIMGGEKKSKEKARMRKGINIMLATPGRLLDHLHNTTTLCLDNIKYLVIDEADRLLDMGFEKDVSEIVSIISERCCSKRQNILLSATLSTGVERLAGISLENPVKVDTADNSLKSSVPDHTLQQKNEVFATPESLKHHYVIVPSKLRLVTLAAFILWKAKYSSKGKKLVVFLSTQFSVEFHYKILKFILSKALGDDENDSDLFLYSLHGNMTQDERIRSFQKFTKTDHGVLLCTDVAARGLNLENVRWIVQYNTPGSATDYIHRVGRTARIGSQGHALLFLVPSEVEYLKVLQKYQISFSEMKMDDVLKTLLINAVKWNVDGRPVPHSPHECATAVQVITETFIQESKDMRTLARKAYQSFIRSYTTYPTSVKHIFHLKFLHLGHVAKSFGLQDAPKQIANVVSKTMTKSQKRTHAEKDPMMIKPAKMAKLDLISEFSSGLDGVLQKSQSRSGPKNKKKQKLFLPKKTNMKKHRRK